jgi:hypothetical protein
MLQYRLSSDNAKVGAISIQTNEELLLFKDRMRKLIVPPRLANGRASTRIPKAVLVYFEDASGETKESRTTTSTSGSKKVFVLYYIRCKSLISYYFVEYPSFSCITSKSTIYSKWSDRIPGSEDANY